MTDGFPRGIPLHGVLRRLLEILHCPAIIPSAHKVLRQFCRYLWGPCPIGAFQPCSELAVQVDGLGEVVIEVVLEGANDAPRFEQGQLGVQLQENRTDVVTVRATDVEGDELRYVIAGGADAQRLQIDEATGALRLRQAADYENPQDEDGNNTYEVIVQAEDGQGGVGQQVVTVRITDELENDSDGDGVDQEEEGQVPNGGGGGTGDGNGDGVADAQQSHVSSVPLLGPGGQQQFVTLQSQEGVGLKQVRNVEPGSVAQLPQDLDAPLGVIAFRAEGVTQGGLQLVHDVPLDVEIGWGPNWGAAH